MSAKHPDLANNVPMLLKVYHCAYIMVFAEHPKHYIATVATDKIGLQIT